MKRSIKIIISLILVIVFLIACFALIMISFVAMWLHTYQVFTKRTPVAEIVISEQKKDELGEYVNVKLTMIEGPSALDETLAPNPNVDRVEKDEQNFKLYGDTVHVGGPIVKFHDHLILVNFETIYKVGQIYARYNLDNDAERERTPEMQSTYQLNGGFADWKNINENLKPDSENFLAPFYRAFIDTTFVDSPGMYASSTQQKYILYITSSGFITVHAN